MQIEDFVDEAALEALYRPIDEALGLPASVYSEAFYELENRCLFPRTWSAVAVGSQIPESGDALPVMLGNWPIFLVRRDDGEITAFLNICRHRGMRILTESKHDCERIQCPWYGWTYDLDGKLIAAPNFNGWRQDGRAALESKQIALRRIAVGVWHDLVFVNIDENAAPFENHCEPLKDLIGEMDMASLSYAGLWEYSYAGNWKTAMDGGIESYYLPWGHPQLVQGVQTYTQDTICHGHCYAALSTRYTLPASNARGDDGLAASAILAASLPSVWKPDANGELRYLFGNIFPTGIFFTGPDYFLHVLFTPDGWDRTRAVVYFYYKGKAATDPALRAARKQIEDQWKVIIKQDDEFVKYVQANTLVRDRAGILPSFSPYWEGAVHHFQKMVVETIQEGQAANP